MDLAIGCRTVACILHESQQQKTHSGHIVDEELLILDIYLHSQLCVVCLEMVEKEPRLLDNVFEAD